MSKRTVVLWHASPIEFREQIEAEGILMNKCSHYPWLQRLQRRGVYAFLSRFEANEWAHSEHQGAWSNATGAVLWAIKWPLRLRVHVDPMLMARGAVVLPRDIPADWLECHEPVAL